MLDRDKYITVSKLIAEFNRVSGVSVSGNTVRRYLKEYSEYFSIVRADGMMYVDAKPAIVVLKAISANISSGRNRGKWEIRGSLRKIGIQPVAVSENKPANASGGGVVKKITVSFDDESKALLKVIADRLADVIKKKR